MHAPRWIENNVRMLCFADARHKYSNHGKVLWPLLVAFLAVGACGKSRKTAKDDVTSGPLIIHGSYIRVDSITISVEDHKWNKSSTAKRLSLNY